jgi:hypothetical protein
VKRINEHVIRPAAESFVGAVIDALPQSAVEQLSNSRGFESAMEAGRTVSGGIMHGSQEALGMLSPMDGAAEKLLKGDLRGAGNEAMLEAFGGRVFKAAGKGMAAVKRHAGQLDEAVGALSHADDAATATATGVRESIEEASSVLAKEGGGVAKTPASFFQSTRLEVEALQAQGLSRSEAFTQIRSFNAGNADGYVFHFTTPKGGRGILDDGFINPSTSGVAGPGVYTGTTPMPSWVTKNVPFVGWGLGGKGANVRIPIQTTQPSVTHWLPPQTRVFRDPLPIGGGN